MKKHLISLLLALTLTACLPLSVSAHPVPDMTRKGSITVTMRYNGKPVPGGSLTLYRVGKLHEDDGNYSFVPVTAVQGCVTSFDDIQSPELAAALAEYAKKQGLINVTTRTIGNDGTVTFSDLKLGLYLLVQKTAAPGYGKAPAFLVSVPYRYQDQYLYDVTSTPKTSLTREVPPTEPPFHGEKLPQTGQLWWPVPVLSAAGLLFVIVGLLRRRGSRYDS